MSLENMAIKDKQKPGRRTIQSSAKVKVERSRQIARECRVRKRMRYQYLEDLVKTKEKSIFKLQQEVQLYRKICNDVDTGIVPDFLHKGDTIQGKRKQCSASAAINEGGATQSMDLNRQNSLEAFVTSRNTYPNMENKSTLLSILKRPTLLQSDSITSVFPELGSRPEQPVPTKGDIQFQRNLTISETNAINTNDCCRIPKNNEGGRNQTYSALSDCSQNLKYTDELQLLQNKRYGNMSACSSEISDESDNMECLLHFPSPSLDLDTCSKQKLTSALPNNVSTSHGNFYKPKTDPTQNFASVEWPSNHRTKDTIGYNDMTKFNSEKNETADSKCYDPNPNHSVSAVGYEVRNVNMLNNVQLSDNFHNNRDLNFKYANHSDNSMNSILDWIINNESSGNKQNGHVHTTASNSLGSSGRACVEKSVEDYVNYLHSNF